MGWVEEPDRTPFEDSDQKHACKEAADVSEPGHTAAWLSRAQASAYQLKQEPDTEGKPGRYVHQAREKTDDRNQD